MAFHLYRSTGRPEHSRRSPDRHHALGRTLEPHPFFPQSYGRHSHVSGESLLVGVRSSPPLVARNLFFLVFRGVLVMFYVSQLRSEVPPPQESTESVTEGRGRRPHTNPPRLRLHLLCGSQGPRTRTAYDGSGCVGTSGTSWPVHRSPCRSSPCAVGVSPTRHHYRRGRLSSGFRHSQFFSKTVVQVHREAIVLQFNVYCEITAPLLPSGHLILTVKKSVLLCIHLCVSIPWLLVHKAFDSLVGSESSLEAVIIFISSSVCWNVIYLPQKNCSICKSFVVED